MSKEYWRRTIELLERYLDQGFTPNKAFSLSMTQVEMDVLEAANREARQLLKKLGIDGSRTLKKHDQEMRDLLKSVEIELESIPTQIDSELWKKEYLKPKEREYLMTLIRGMLGL